MTANTPHIVFDELAARSPVPLVSVIVCTRDRSEGITAAVRSIQRESEVTGANAMSSSFVGSAPATSELRTMPARPRGAPDD